VILVRAFIKKKFVPAQKGTTNDKLFRERRDKKKNKFFIFKKECTLLRLINFVLILKEIYK